MISTRDREEPDPASEGYLGSETPPALRPARHHYGDPAPRLGAGRPQGPGRRPASRAGRADLRGRGQRVAAAQADPSVSTGGGGETGASGHPGCRPPWDGFREAACAHYETLFVARSEKRRGRGQGHNDTIYRVGTEEGRKAGLRAESRGRSDRTRPRTAEGRHGRQQALG